MMTVLVLIELVYAGCLFPDGAGAQKLKSSTSANLDVIKLDVTSDADVQSARKFGT